MRNSLGSQRSAHGIVFSSQEKLCTPLLRNSRDTYVVRAAATSAASIAELTGRPLRRGGIWVLPLACHSGDGAEHLGRHVLR